MYLNDIDKKNLQLHQQNIQNIQNLQNQQLGYLNQQNLPHNFNQQINILKNDGDNNNKFNQQNNSNNNTAEQIQNSNSQIDDELNTKQKRRTRHDPVNRDFFCGCGKSYLSYPALYTHLKQKHGGVHPAGTFQIQITKNLQELQVDQYAVQQEQVYYQVQIQDVYDEIISFLENQGFQPKKQDIEKSQLGQKLLEQFPKDLFESEKQYNKIFEILMKLQNHQEYISQVIDEETEDNLSISCMRDFCIFVCIYSQALNQLGWKALGYNNNPQYSEQEFCEVNSGENALLICNEFIIDFLPNYFEDNQNYLKIEPQNRLLGPEPEKLKNAVYLVQYFSNWLFVLRYSKAKLNLQITQFEQQNYEFQNENKIMNENKQDENNCLQQTINPETNYDYQQLRQTDSIINQLKQQNSDMQVQDISKINSIHLTEGISEKKQSEMDFSSQNQQ
ncbi:hypothetical protein PPERSA_01758 [Pseudocohnilembus persalinus]|uniref:Uncharacterized protein n=1 Tax=Pseudocohnilembus persalinus TaxID=266149 RepID=A0A0V0R178_PSEPJ|nr:hypothetical protein PPERSA_01758 [Pseudocohnilembus persalinus]|eukprot:KRX08297.1 hypothetical protein PPERSA_01758 [Pseudocohnilembus persalinus]